MKNISFGDRGTSVQYLQLALRRAGYTIQIDGIFGPSTCEKLREFAGSRVGEDCTADERIWNLLLPYLRGYTRYTTRQGDTLWSIAAQFETNVAAIMTANSLTIPEQLQAGWQLVIPYDFEVVTDEVSYSYELLRYILEGLRARYPFLRLGSIGRSVQGKEIPYITLGNGDREVCYNASFHANEWITTPLLLKFVQDYANAYAADRLIGGISASNLFEIFRLYLIPMVNPDGVDLVTGMADEESYQQAAQIAADYPQIPFPQGWKANIEGVDLNLQYPAGWEQAREIKFAQGYVSPAPRDYVGAEPLSAPESVAVFDFTLVHDFELILAYHTQGRVIYWKYLDYEPEGSAEIAAYFGEVSGYTVEETPIVSGYAGYKDWFIQNYNRPGYTIEVGEGVNPLPLSQFPAIYEDNRGILEGGMTQLLIF